VVGKEVGTRVSQAEGALQVQERALVLETLLVLLPALLLDLLLEEDSMSMGREMDMGMDMDMDMEASVSALPPLLPDLLPPLLPDLLPPLLPDLDPLPPLLPDLDPLPPLLPLFPGEQVHSSGALSIDMDMDNEMSSETKELVALLPPLLPDLLPPSPPLLPDLLLLMVSHVSFVNGRQERLEDFVGEGDLILSLLDDLVLLVLEDFDEVESMSIDILMLSILSWSCRSISSLSFLSSLSVLRFPGLDGW